MTGVKEHSLFPYPEWVDRLEFDVNKATWLELDGGIQDTIRDYGAMFTSQSYRLKKNDMDVGDENDTSAKTEGAFAGMRYRNQKGATTFPTLGLGSHTLEFEKRPLQILYFTIGDVVGLAYNAEIMTKIVLICEGTGEIAYLQRFVDEVVKMSRKDEPSDTFPIYRWDHCRQYWRRERRVSARSIDSVVLPKDDKERLLNDWDSFLSKETMAWYKGHGIPYKRSYLFYGVPGTGKTSIIQALAGKYKRKVCFLHAHHPKFTDDAFKKCMLEVPDKAVIVLEDIDALFGKNRQKKAATQVPLTFTGLLNGLDGIGHKDGMIVVATTNYIDRLDDALIRAGRMDVKVEFKRATHWQLEATFLRFYKDSGDFATQFADRVLAKWPKSLAMSQLQQHFIDHRCSSAKECLEGIEAFDAGKEDEKKEEEKEEAKEKAKKKEEPTDDEKEDKKAPKDKSPAPKDQSPAPSTASDATSAGQSAAGVASAAEETPIRFTMELGGRKIQFSCEPTSSAAPTVVATTTDDAAAKPALPSAKKLAGLSEGSEKSQERAVIAN